MIDRRDMLVGGATLGAAAAAAVLMPRRHLVLAQPGTLEKAVPKTFGPWAAADTDGVVVPKDEDDLASRLYSQVIQRVYQRPDTGEYVMLLIAYGDTQNDLLQLHRPEVCYAAFGFAISGSRAAPLPIAPGVALPARQLVATGRERVEYISYWTRIGEYFPVDGRQQRWDKLRLQFAGIVPDGALVRISTGGADAAAAFALNAAFAADFMAQVAPAGRPALVGAERARQIGPRRA